MMDNSQLQKLRDLPIEGVAERLGMQIVRHKALCPFHDDHHASLSFCTRRNTFRCFACGAHGGTIDLVMKRQNMGFKEACQWLKNDQTTTPLQLPRGGEFDGAEQKASPRGGLEGVSRYSRFFEHPFLNEEARRFLFDERHLDERVIRWCRLTSWKDRREVPWLQIPYYDQEGRLVGVQNRNLVKGGLPRFRFPQGSECGIYNLPILKRLKPGDELWIAEGCSDCWALLSAGHKAIAIPSATLLSKKDKTLLSSLEASPRGGLEGVSFHMYPDQDAPGERLFLQLQKVLPTLVHHQLPEGCKDYGEYYINPSPSPPRGRV
jgi:DNA primase